MAVAATWPRRGNSVETGRSDAAAATWIIRGRTRRGHAAAATCKFGKDGRAPQAEAVGPIYDNSTAALQRAFAIFDQDGDGGITRDEFATIMDRLHLLPRGDDAAAAKAVDEMFTLADLDHNGSISFDEFRMMYVCGAGLSTDVSRRRRGRDVDIP